MNDQTLPARQDMPPGHHTARRAHLMNEMTARHRRPAGRRLLAGGLATAVLAGGLTTALVMAPTAEVGGNPPVALAGASEVLNRAATTAAGRPSLEPRAGQFVYAESKSVQTLPPAGAGKPAGPGKPILTKSWLPVSGDQAGLVDSSDLGLTWLCDAAPNATGTEPKALPKVDVGDPPSGCHNVSAYRKGLPADPDAMRSWLYRGGKGGVPADVRAFVAVGDTLRDSYVAPAAMAAVFKAAATIPGVTLTGATTDLAGRKGIAVGQTWHGLRHELIFENRTYRLLGERQVVDHRDSLKAKDVKPGKPASGKRTPDPLDSMKAGTVLFDTAYLMLSITDEVARTPAK